MRLSSTPFDIVEIPVDRAFRAVAPGLEPSPLINSSSSSVSFSKQVRAFLLLATSYGLPSVLLAFFSVLGLSGCGQQLYKFPRNTFAGRPVPPSQLANRVLVSITSGSQGALEILDGNRDLRNNVQNTVNSFSVSGYSGNNPTTILSYPAELRGYVYANASPFTINPIDYSKETTLGSATTLNSAAPSFAIAPGGLRIYAALEQAGQLVVFDSATGATYPLNLPNVYKVAANRGDTVALAMVRNSNSIYRVVKLNINQLSPPGAIDCQPNLLPVYCVVPVAGTFDRPVDISYSLDGANAYVLNCGRECGGGTNGGSSVSFIPQGALQVSNIPSATPYPVAVTRTVPVPGGVTTALSDGANLYLAGQAMQPDGLFAGNLSTLNLGNFTVGAPVSISDGNHSKLIFADDNTLWVGSQFCATGERAKLGLNYNCLTRYDLGAHTATIVPAIAAATPGSPATVPYPNADNNLLYYGSLTGICWVEDHHKVYTAYGGQIHAFNTADATEINNFRITVQGSALDVAYMDAQTDSAN